MATVSTTVVMSGAAISAGSIPSRFAAMGSSPPVTFAQTTVQSIAADTTPARRRSLYLSMINAESATARPKPTSSATRSSIQMIRAVSAKRSSSTARPRMIRVELWEPQFPPVSIIIGIKDTSRGTAANAASYFEMIAPVILAESISTSSQTMRCFACFQAGVLR